MGKKLYYLGKKIEKLGRNTTILVIFPQIEGNFLWISRCFLPHFSRVSSPPPGKTIFWGEMTLYDLARILTSGTLSFLRHIGNLPLLSLF